MFGTDLNPLSLQNLTYVKKRLEVFGIPGPFLAKCHRFVVIPTRKSFCLNLATALATILWDRAMKLDEIPDDREAGQGYEETKPEEMGLFDTKPGWP